MQFLSQSLSDASTQSGSQWSNQWNNRFASIQSISDTLHSIRSGDETSISQATKANSQLDRQANSIQTVNQTFNQQSQSNKQAICTVKPMSVIRLNSQTGQSTSQKQFATDNCGQAIDHLIRRSKTRWALHSAIEQLLSLSVLQANFNQQQSLVI